MSHVFISYSYDDEDKALALKSYITDEGIDTFASYKINPGNQWRDELNTAIDEAFAMIVICTKSSMSSFEVCFEWSFAMGLGIPIFPVIYEKNCELHSRLQTLQNLDFSSADPRMRPWGKLISFLKDSKTRNHINLGVIKKAGIEQIFFSREELENLYAISSVLKLAENSSEIIIIARSCEAWARQYRELENTINSKNICIRMAMVDPNISQEQWMISSDWARLDVNAVLEKLKMIKLSAETTGSLSLYWLPSSPLFSFVSFKTQSEGNIGILEAGASLSLNERVCLVLKASDNAQGLLLQRVQKIHERTFTLSRCVFSIGAVGDNKNGKS